MTGLLEGKVALISGGAKGIGAEVARMMCAEGASVVIGDVLEEQGHKTAEQLSIGNGNCDYVSLDVSKEESWIRAVDHAQKRFGKLNCLINNAGIYLGQNISDVSMEDWERMVAVNMTGVFLGTRVCTDALQKAAELDGQWSSIVNLSSIAGIRAAAGDPLYSMTKGGVLAFSNSVAMRFAKTGFKIRVNSVNPGVIETDMGQQSTGKAVKDLNLEEDVSPFEFAATMHPVGRLGRVEDVANAIIYLASEKSSFVTGTKIVVDGGFTA